MQFVRIDIEPWLAQASLRGEAIIARWTRRLAAHHAAHDPSATAVIDGHMLALDDHTLALALQGSHLSGPRIQSLADLWALEQAEMAHTRQALMAQGVQLIGPGPSIIGPRVQVHCGATLWPGCILLGETQIASNVVVGVGCVLQDVTVAANVTLRPYTVATSTTIAEQATIGPFSHLRPATQIGVGSHVGNFVETKNAVIHPGAKANHLSYLGDCSIGANANIGAGTITCNYDGARKHHTHIGPGAFIGSNTAIVAPVTIGEQALIAAGSTIVRDVPAGALAVARGHQRNIDDLGAKKLHDVQQTRRPQNG